MRSFLFAAAVLLAAPLDSDAQPAKVRRIGILTTAVAPATPPIEEFRRGLRELGYVEGQGITLEYRFAQDRFDRLQALAEELVGLKVDVIVTEGTAAAQSAKKVTTSIENRRPGLGAQFVEAK